MTKQRQLIKLYLSLMLGHLWQDTEFSVNRFYDLQNSNENRNNLGQFNFFFFFSFSFTFFLLLFWDRDSMQPWPSWNSQGSACLSLLSERHHPGPLTAFFWLGFPYIPNSVGWGVSQSDCIICEGAALGIYIWLVLVSLGAREAFLFIWEEEIMSPSCVRSS